MATPLSTAALNALWVTGYIPTQSDFENLFVSSSNLTDNNALDLNDLAITAHAGGGQGSAYQITKRISQVTTVATAGDSVKLPPALVGREGYLFNTQSKAIDVFPDTGDSFINSTANVAFSLPGAWYIFYRCLANGVYQFEIMSDTGLKPNLPNIQTTGATLNPILSLANVYQFTALASNLVVNPPNWQYGGGTLLYVLIKDDGTSRTITWGGSFRGISAQLPSTTIPSKQMYFTFMYNDDTQKWELISVVWEGMTNKAIATYRALISQTGTASPTATILENTLGIVPSWSRVGAGNYTLTATGLLTSGKVMATIQGALTGGYWASCNTLSSPNTWQFETFNNIGAGQDAKLNNTPVEIRIYL